MPLLMQMPIANMNIIACLDMGNLMDIWTFRFIRHTVVRASSGYRKSESPIMIIVDSYLAT